MKLKRRTKAKLKFAAWCLVVATSGGFSYGFVKSAVVAVLQPQPQAEKEKDKEKPAVEPYVFAPNVGSSSSMGYSMAVSSAPEPSSLILFGLGTTLLLRRKRA